MSLSMRVAVVGTGHVGLVTAVALASLGHQVKGADADREKVRLLKGGIPPFYEPGLAQALAEVMGAGRLSFHESVAEAVSGAEVVFICVGTPPREDGEANLAAVERSAREVARAASAPDTGEPLVVVEKSTVPAGTAERLRLVLERERPGFAFEVVSNPEFLREGEALRDALCPTRILVGAFSAKGFAVMRRVYAPLLAKGVKLIETDPATAELAKHASNAFLALKVSYANALARVCERAGADVEVVVEVMGADPRIGRDFLRPGIGWGGYCFPKDLAAFARLADRLGYPFPLLEEAARINEEAARAAVDKVGEALWNLEDKRIALLGLSYKPGTDDVRFSPALAVARALLAKGARVVGHDPRAEAAAKAEVPELELASDPYEAAAGAHCLVLCTEWEEFRSLDLERLKELMAYPIVVDGRNLFDPAAMRRAGFTYYPMGRPPVIQRGP